MQDTNLTPEAEFTVVSTCRQIDRMSREQTQEFAKLLISRLAVQEQVYKQLLREK